MMIHPHYTNNIQCGSYVYAFEDHVQNILSSRLIPFQQPGQLNHAHSFVGGRSNVAPVCIQDDPLSVQVDDPKPIHLMSQMKLGEIAHVIEERQGSALGALRSKIGAVADGTDALAKVKLVVSMLGVLATHCPWIAVFGQRVRLDVRDLADNGAMSSSHGLLFANAK
jgi:hypothetical protein